MANPHPLAARPTYTREQLEAFVKEIAPNPSYTLSTLESEIASDPLRALGLLQLRTLGFNTWGNLALHYSSHRTLDLNPDALFHKIVRRKHGGYCMENNAFFSTVLRSLGIQHYVSGARVSAAVMQDGDPAGFHGVEHEVILATVGGKKYLVDVGFGAANPLFPMELVDGAEQKTTPGSYARLVHRGIAPFTDASQKMWVLETGNDSHPGVWTPAYCFGEAEWLPADFEVINFRTSRDPKSWFTNKLVLVRMLLDEKRERAIGTVTVQDGEVARRLEDGKREVVVSAENEEQRVKALKEWLGIELLPEETTGIRGLVTELKAPAKV